MKRWACVCIPAPGLQAWAARDPSVRTEPAALIAGEGPRAQVTAMNRRAHDARVRCGQRARAARELVAGLRVRRWEPSDDESVRAELLPILWRFSPHVEPQEEPGVFLLDARGMGAYYGQEISWLEALLDALCDAGFAGRGRVASTRWSAWALATCGLGPPVVSTPEQERAWLARCPVSRVLHEPEASRGLRELGVHTLADLRAIPEASWRERLGPEVAALVRRLRPPTPRAKPAARHARTLDLEHPTRRVDALLRHAERALAEILRGLVGLQVSGVRMTLGFEGRGAGSRAFRQEPAEPVEHAAPLLELLRLSMVRAQWPSAVVWVTLEVEVCRARPRQVEGWVGAEVGAEGVDLEGARRALARVRARHGAQAVCTARVLGTHDPGARHMLTPSVSLQAPAPAPARASVLVRVISPATRDPNPGAVTEQGRWTTPWWEDGYEERRVASARRAGRREWLVTERGRWWRLGEA